MSVCLSSVWQSYSWTATAIGTLQESVTDEHKILSLTIISKLYILSFENWYNERRQIALSD